MHNSNYGHIVPRRKQVTHELKPRMRTRELHRKRYQHYSKVLVVASWNYAVDNILEQLDAEGIPYGKDHALFPRILRIARYDYVAPLNLALLLVCSAATTYDHEKRNKPSLQAKRRVENECIMFLSTYSATGSSQLKELNQKFDVNIHDEAENYL